MYVWTFQKSVNKDAAQDGEEGGSGGVDVCSTGQVDLATWETAVQRKSLHYSLLVNRSFV